MRKILTLLIISLLLISTFSIITPHVKADMSSATGLYAGSTNPGVVWEYKGGTDWESITTNPSQLGWSVTSIINYEGRLYASTISDPYIHSSSGKVWRYEGAKTWTLVNDGLAVNQVTFLIIYKGELYAGTATPARLYKFNPATDSWTKVLEYTPWFGFRSAYVWGDWLYLGEWYWDRFARWDGTTFQEFQPHSWGSCIYSIEEYGDYLYAGAYIGRIYKITSEPPTATAIWGPEPNYRYAWSLKTFKDYLYIGFDANGTGIAPLYRYNGASFTKVWSYPTTTDNYHEGIISMATDGTYLYIGVGGQAVGYPTYMSGDGAGKVYRSSDGINFELISSIMGTGIQVLYVAPEKPLHVKAAELAIKVIGKAYYTELGNRFTKGWKDGRFVNPEEIEYLDCSGLVYWAYNKAYGATKYSPWDKESYTIIDQMKVKFHNPIAFEGAENQYWYNTERIEKNDLQPGDLLFFDTPRQGNPDHVAIYVGGPFEYEYGQGEVFVFNTVEATAWGDSIITVAYHDVNTGYLTTLKPSTGDTRLLKVNYYGRVKFPVVIPFGVVKSMGIVTKSPVNLIVRDPEGFVISGDLREISNMIYLESDMNEDGELDNIVLVLERRIGDYLITVTPKHEATFTDTYSLEVLVENMTISLAEGVQISDIPTKPYIIRSTETEVIPVIPATVDFDPDTLNLESKGKWITVYVELPVGHGYNVSMINITSVVLNGCVQPEVGPIEIGDYDGDGISDLMIKFSRKMVQSILEIGEEVEIEITGALIDQRLFEGKDTIKVICLP